MKTRHATFEQLLEIEASEVEAMQRVESLMERAMNRRFGMDSRHYRRLYRRFNHHWARYIAAQRRQNQIIHERDPEFIF